MVAVRPTKVSVSNPIPKPMSQRCISNLPSEAVWPGLLPLAVLPSSTFTGHPRTHPGSQPARVGAKDATAMSGPAPGNQLLEQFIAIPSGNPRDDDAATLVLAVRLRSGIMKSDGPPQSLQLGVGQRVPELLTVCRRAGALNGVDGRL